MLRLRPTVWTPQVDEHVAHDSHGRTTQWMGHGPGTEKLLIQVLNYKL